MEMTSTPFGLPLGIHHDVPEHVYHRPEIGVASKSALDRVAQSPAHYYAWLSDPGKPTPEMVFGTRVHCAVLEPDRFEREYVVAPDFGDGRTKAAKAKKAAWLAEFGNLTAIHADDMARIRGIRDSVMRHPLASKLLSGGAAEITATWKDDESGVLCKARVDYLPGRRVAVDLKTAKDASIDGFGKAVANYGYHRQAAFYLDGLRAAGSDVETFLFVAVEKVPPFAIGVHMLDSDAMMRARDTIRRDLQRMATSLAAGAWEAYPARINEISLPAWA